MKKLAIITIFLLALFLRVYKLGQFPVGFLWDEASLGYNAYSILKTGRDEYGSLLPMIFKSFGDYKPGLYVYLTVPFVMLFGLNEFSVRLPSALAGTAAVMLVYLIIEEGFDKKEKNEKIPFIASFILALSPWHINFSRGAWELNLMLTEILLGVFCLIKFLNSRKNFWLWFGGTSLLLTLFTYQTAKFLLPVLFFFFFLSFREKIFPIQRKLKFRFFAVMVIGYLLFNLLTLLGGKAGRLKVMSLFSYPRSDTESSMILTQDNGNETLFNFFHGQAIFFARSILGRYFNYFSGRFLFVEGDWSNLRNGIIYQGVLYYLDLIFLILGLGILLAKDRNPFENFVLFWLLIAPLPGALTRDSISSVRSFSMVIPLIFIIATGVSGFVVFLRKYKPVVQYSLFIILFLSYFFFFVRFLDLYFVHNPIFSSKDRLYGYKEMVDYIKPMIESKNKVIITTELGQPYIFYLFYSRYDPKLYQKQAFLRENPYGDVGEVGKIDNIEFRKIYFPNDRAFKNSLFVGDEFGLPLQDIVGQEGITFLKEIKFLNGKTAFRVVETSPSPLGRLGASEEQVNKRLLGISGWVLVN